VRVFGILDDVIRFWEPYTDTGYTILIHGLIHRLDYIRVTILCHANIIMTRVLTITATVSIMNAMTALDGRLLSKTHSVHDVTYHHSVEINNNPTFLPVQPPLRDMGILNPYPNPAMPLVLAYTPIPGPVAADGVISHDEGGGA
jgi:hypothetical protein